MSLFNEIKRNVTDAANATTKKATEFTGIAKLNVNIKLEETKLSECYEEIGRLFYTAERSGEDNTSDIATYIMQADKIKATIANYRKELSKLKKVVICEGCGTEISEDAAYCSVCGTKQVKKVEDDVPAEEHCCGCCCEEESECGDDCCECENEESCCCETEETCDCEGECDCECNCETPDEDTTNE